MVGLYEGKYKIPDYQNGHAYLTSHRICYVGASEPRKYSVAIDLKEVDRVEYQAGFLRSSPKVAIYPKTLKKHTGPSAARAIAHAPLPTYSASQRAASPSSEAFSPISASATWVCPICTFSNPVPSNFDPSTATASTPLPPCLACGIKPPLTVILKAAIASAANRGVLTTPLPLPTPARQRLDTAGLDSIRDGHLSSGPANQGHITTCPRCTFANHPSLLECEMCGSSLKRLNNATPDRSDSPASLFLTSQLENTEINESMKLSFRGGGEKIFHERLNDALVQRKWLLHDAPPIPQAPSTASQAASNTESGSSPTMEGSTRLGGVGIAGLERRGFQTRKKNEAVIGSAFEDLEALMASAKEIVALAETLAAEAGTKSNDPSVEANTVISQSAAALGMITTKDMLGAGSSSENLYLSELSRNLAEYLTDDRESVLRREGGIISLIDLWAVFNRRRNGVELISPSDFYKATELWEKLKLPVRLRRFKSGLLVVQPHDWTDERCIRLLESWLNELQTQPPAVEVYWDWTTYGRGVTAQEAAQRFGWSVGVAAEELEMAEDRGVLCREEGIEGTRFWRNHLCSGNEGETKAHNIMGLLATEPILQNATVRPLWALSHGRVVLNPACTARHDPLKKHRRTIGWYKRGGGGDWYSRVEAKLQRPIEKANHAPHGVRPRSGGCRSRGGNIWGWPRFGTSKFDKEKKLANGWSAWEWDHSAWEKTFSAEQERFEREFEDLKRQIDADPYGALFGERLRRLRPFSHGPKDASLSSFFRYIFGIDNSAASTGRCSADEDTTASKRTTRMQRDLTSNSRKEPKFQFDPVSGRMIPKSIGNTILDKESLEAAVNDVVDIPRPNSGSKLPNDNKERHSSMEMSEPSGALDQDHSKTPIGMRQRGNQTDDLPDLHSINGALGQQSKDGVWLMGGPQTNNTGPIFTTRGTSYAEDKEPSDAFASPVRSAQSLFANFKDYLSPKHETHRHQSTMENTSGSEESHSGEALRKGPTVSHNALYTDPERLNIETLRANDVRAAFEQRKSELEAQTWESRADIEADSQPLRTSEAHGIQSETVSTSHCATPPVTSAVSDHTIRDNDENLVKEIRTIYENAYGKIVTTQGEAPGVTGTGSLSSTTSVEQSKESEFIENLQARISALLSKASATLDEVRSTNDAIKTSLQDAFKSATDSQSNSLTDYRVLAYDSSNMQIRDAGITSTFPPSFTPLHPIEALSRLNTPSKFLGFFPALAAQGFEIYSASGDVLVFKKTREGGFEVATKNEVDTPGSSASESVHSPRQAAELEEEAIDEVENYTTGSGTKTNPTTRQQEKPATSKQPEHSPREAARLEEESIQDFEAQKSKSPSSSTNVKPSAAQIDTAADPSQQSVHSPKQAARQEQESIEDFESTDNSLRSTGLHSQSPTPVTVRRQETHFTGGPPNWSPYDPNAEPKASLPRDEGRVEKKGGFLSSLRKAFRRALLTGVATGATFYAIGVVAEYFRTGGQDGLGPRGFTGLEGSLGCTWLTPPPALYEGHGDIAAPPILLELSSPKDNVPILRNLGDSYTSFARPCKANVSGQPPSGRSLLDQAHPRKSDLLRFP
ncbi:conserved hypothetical protein [Uncinocarpus reesii 1704]|uniref:ESCRT-II complex subunit VPS36 n=1 Tax=Uncinocarpus reesii (strain UAMH 1704) TaxID=336963 RepID=C4JH78_UNCRE|nr:uncharacterized protein UREG_02651 [Uncinocarpus reesii 1704]EEP77802.1 conserved hypothetical protein [Uncinocarpus reesii 1704]